MVNICADAAQRVQADWPAHFSFLYRNVYTEQFLGWYF